MSDRIPEELLSAYLDGELSPEDAEKLRVQIAQSDQAGELQEFRENQARLRKLPSFQLDGGFADRVLARLEFADVDADPGGTQLASAKVPTAYRYSIRGAMAAIVTLAALLLVVLLQVPPSQESSSNVADVTDSESSFEDSVEDEGIMSGLENDSEKLESAGSEPGGRLNSDKLENIRKNENPFVDDSGDLDHELKKKIAGVQPGSKKSKLDAQTVDLGPVKGGTRGNSDMTEKAPAEGVITKQKRSSKPNAAPFDFKLDEKKSFRSGGGLAGGGTGGAGIEKGGRGSALVQPIKIQSPRILEGQGNLVLGNVAFGNAALNNGFMPKTNTNNQIVQIQVAPGDFDNGLVEKTLLRNQIACRLPNQMSLSAGKLNASGGGSDRVAPESKTAAPEKAKQQGQQFTQSERQNASPNRTRFLYIEADRKRLLDSLKELHATTRISPHILESPENAPQNMLQLPSAGFYAESDQRPSESSESKLKNRLAQLNRARNYVDPEVFRRQQRQIQAPERGRVSPKRNRRDQNKDENNQDKNQIDRGGAANQDDVSKVDSLKDQKNENQSAGNPPVQQDSQRDQQKESNLKTVDGKSSNGPDAYSELVKKLRPWFFNEKELGQIRLREFERIQQALDLASDSESVLQLLLVIQSDPDLGKIEKAAKQRPSAPPPAPKK